MERMAGFQSTQVLPNGERNYFFEFNDRGRGPKLSTRVVLDRDLLPILIQTSGVSYLKNDVEEQFSIQGQQARWRNKVENGEITLTGKAFYIPTEEPPEGEALLARALLRSPDHRLAILPSGEATIERVDELSLENGGVTKKTTLYLISGLSFLPSPIWLDESGEFFGSISAWFSIVREGWEKSVPTLLKSQQAVEAKRDTSLALALARKPGKPVVIKGAAVFDSESAKIRPNTTVVVSGERIAALGPSAHIPAESVIIDATGKTIVPGLWDMHTHLQKVSGLMNIAAGITTARDMGNDIDSVTSMRRAWDSGEAIGPRVILAGFLDGRGPYAGPSKVLVDTEDEVRAAIDKYVSLHYEQTKVYSSIKPELVPFIVNYSHQRGLRVSGHVPAFMTAEQVVKLGFNELQHANFLFLNFLADRVKDTRTPERLTAVAEYAAELDLDSSRVQAFIKLLKEKNVVVDPTLVAFEPMFTNRPDKPSPTYAAIAERLPPRLRRSIRSVGLPVPKGKDERYRESFRAMVRMVAALDRAKVRIVAGTDSFPAGFSLPRELELYVEAGISPARVLQLATLGAAQVMKRDRELGSITPGKLADLVIIDGDPSSQISDIRRVATVIKNGVIYDANAICRALGIGPYDPLRTYSDSRGRAVASQ